MEKDKVVIKFGGVSLKNSERLKSTAKIIKNNLDKDLVVVISAIGDSTNELIKAGEKASNGRIDFKGVKTIHEEICSGLDLGFTLLEGLFLQIKKALECIKEEKQFSKKNNDLMMSFGEQLSIIVLSEYLKTQNIKAEGFNSWDIGLISDSNYGKAAILEKSSGLIKYNIEKIKRHNILPIVTGFISKESNGNITTLGRGGSDLTASYIAQAIAAKRVILWKDVEGILTSDPKLVKNTRKINCISYKEAAEMAYYGAEILHPQAIFPAMEKNIAVWIKNFLEPDAVGTKIVDAIDYLKEQSHIKTISYRTDITLIHIESNRMLGHYGFLARVFEVFDALKISVDMIATSEVSISLTLDESHDLDTLKKALSHFAHVKITKEQSIISLIGNTEESTGIFNQAFDILDKHNINIKMVSYGASHVNIGFIIDSTRLEETINVLHDGMIFEEEVTVC